MTEEIYNQEDAQTPPAEPVAEPSEGETPIASEPGESPAQTEREEEAQALEASAEERAEAHVSTVVEKIKRGETSFTDGEMQAIASKFGVENEEHPFGNVYTAETSPHAGTVAPQRAASPEHRLLHDAAGNELDVDDDGFTEQDKEARREFVKAANNQ